MRQDAETPERNCSFTMSLQTLTQNKLFFFWCNLSVFHIQSVISYITQSDSNSPQREREGARACSIQLWVQYVGGGSDINIFPVKRRKKKRCHADHILTRTRKSALHTGLTLTLQPSHLASWFSLWPDSGKIFAFFNFNTNVTINLY